MLLLLALAAPLASAGDTALYERALQLIDAHYLRAATLSRPAMLQEAADQLESRVEWLLVDARPGEVALRDGDGKWTAQVRLEGDPDLPAALARLEDAVRGAGRALPDELDLRVEILRGVARTLDRHSVVLYAEGLERFDERLSGTLSGIGATISVDENGIFVREVVPDGPAARNGVAAGDRLLTIGGVSTVGMVPSDATERIRGPAGTSVALDVRRGDAALHFAVGREEITIRNVTATAGPNGVGVVTIDHFSEQTRTYLLEALAELRSQDRLANGLVIDLRGNTGGSLIQSAQSADTFLQTGLIVGTTGREGAPVPGLVPRIEARPDAPAYDMPIAVLMDHSTASGSEILAGALGSLGRAVLVGTTSFGKGTVQKVYALEPAIKLKLTVAEYVLEGGLRVAEGGLVPDVALEEVRIGDSGIWFPDPERERLRHRPGTPTLRHVAGDDRALDVAATLVAASAGPSRDEVLGALRAVEAELSTQEEARLASALAERGLDWGAAPAPLDGEPALDVHWSWSAPPTSGGTSTLSAAVTNLGPTLHRAALRLSSVNPAWDDLVLPVGRLERGATRTASVTVTLDPGLPTRTDRVAVALEADGTAPRALASREVTTLGGALPPLAVSARASAPDDAGIVTVTLDLENRADRLLTGVYARVPFPGVEGLELVDARTAPADIPARGSRRVELRLRVRGTYSAPSYPLSLTLADASVRRLAEWDLPLPAAGTPVRLEAPTLALTPPPPVLPPGMARLKIRASDDRALDHIVVYAGVETMNRSRATPVVEHARDKIAWRQGRGRRADLDLAVPVQPGTNRYIVVAEDQGGLRTVREAYVLGDDGGPDATAAPE